MDESIVERKPFTVSIDVKLKTEIEDCFLENRIKNYQEGYRQLIALGYSEFKKGKRVQL